jgi:hypothetical protein
MKKFVNLKLAVAGALSLFTTLTIADQHDWAKPPPPRPNDPRLELQPIFDANGVVYDWKAYIFNPVNRKKQEIAIGEIEKIYRISDISNENSWTISLKKYSQIDRLAPQPQGLRVCLKDIKYPPGSERPHLEYDISGQITVAMTLDCPQAITPKSIYDPKSIGRHSYSMSFLPKNIITQNECSNCVYIENSAYTHPDRSGGPDVASHSDRTMFAYREIVNIIRLYQGTADSLTGEVNGFAYAWQGSRTNPAVSIHYNRHDPEGNFGVVFTIPRGITSSIPNVEGTLKRTANGLTAFFDVNEVTSDSPLPTPPPVTP